jgi:formamidopyrimidine-DNA glycosylase
MPELPEVETIRSQLQAQLVGQAITGYSCSWEKSFTVRGVARDAILGREITGTWRRGKVLGIELSGTLALLVHLRMTGQLLLVEQPDLPEGDARHRMTRASFALSGGGTLLFNDQRKFGRIVLLPREALSSDPLLARMGVEPLDPAFDGAYLAVQLARHPKLMVKAALLDQSVVAGIGNIYADEALWSAQLSPERRCASLTSAEIDTLAGSVVAVLSTALERGGSTLRDYVNLEGRPGGYLEVAQVFGRTGQPCSRCGAPIIKLRLAGRGTHLCPRCQRFST